jgi:hypothetical protein
MLSSNGASSATGACSAAVATGLDSRVRGDPFGIIAASFWNANKERAEMRCAQIGDGKDKNLKPNVWYRYADRLSDPETKKRIDNALKRWSQSRGQEERHA